MKTLHLIFALLAVTLTAMDSEAGSLNETSHPLGGELGRALVLEPSGGRPAAVFVCLHGIQSNKTWWKPLGEELAARGFAVWAYDRPGSGAPSPAGPADISCCTWEAQMANVAAKARAKYGNVRIIAMGVSWGASPAMVSAAAQRNGWARAVLCNPAFVTRKDGALIWTVVLSYFNPMTWLNGKAPLRLPLGGDDYTPNPATRRLPYFADENLKGTATRRFLVTTSKTKKAATASLASTQTPVLVVVGESDPLVPASKLKAKLAELGAENLKEKIETVPSATHAAIIEDQRREYAALIARWVRSLPKR